MDPYESGPSNMEPLSDPAWRWWLWFLCLCLAPIAWAFSFYIVASGLDILT